MEDGGREIVGFSRRTHRCRSIRGERAVAAYREKWMSRTELFPDAFGLRFIQHVLLVQFEIGFLKPQKQNQRHVRPLLD